MSRRIFAKDPNRSAGLTLLCNTNVQLLAFLRKTFGWNRRGAAREGSQGQARNEVERAAPGVARNECQALKGRQRPIIQMASVFARFQRANVVATNRVSALRCAPRLPLATFFRAFGARLSQSACGRRPRRVSVVNAFCVLAVSLSAAGQQTPTSDRYRIGPGDVLDIRVLNRPNLSREAVRVEGNGMIRMPLIDTEIQAACTTEGELAKEISTRYLKFYRNPQVDVFIKEYHSKQVAILGAVNDQSRFELQRRVRLLELLTYAKGPTAKAGQTINIVHSPPALSCEKPGEEADVSSAFSSYKLSDTLQGNPKANPFLEPGDIVTLPEADQIYVVGNVFTPQTIPLREPITLSRAIAMAGGLKQDSNKDKVRIVRQEPGSTTKQEMIVDLSAIEKKRAEDVALLPNDIIDVPTSGAKSFIRSLLGSVAPSVSQLPVRVIP